MSGFLKDVYYVLWGDLMFMRHNYVNIFIASVMSPLLYLLAFGVGLGMGRDLNMDGIPYVAFIIPGIAALSSMSAFSSVSTRLNTQRLFFHSLDDILMCPVSRSAVIIGKAMHGVIRGLISSSIIFAIGLVLAPDYLHLTPLYVISITLSCFAFSLLGVTAAFLAKTHQSMITFNSLVILPMTFLCGTFFSVDGLHALFKAALYALPLTHSSITARASSLGWDFPWVSLIVLSCLSLLFFLISLHLMRKKKV